MTKERQGLKMKRITKKDVYSKYGIEYKKEHILSPIGWIRPVLKNNNAKTGKRTYTFSMPAGTAGTCVMNCPNCYAMVGRYATPSVRNSLSAAQYLIENHIDFMKRAICAQLVADGVEMVRIHASGDFNTKNSEDYAAMWFDIARVFKNVKFWTYTKMPQYESLFDGLDNANIVPSVLPYKIGLNYGTCADVLKMYTLMKKHGLTPHICECGTNDTHHCQDCAGCSANKYVLFIMHSSKTYDAKTDPLLKDVAAIVNAQR